MLATNPNQIITLPGQNELPSDDGIPMETQRHKLQMDLLIYPLHNWLKKREDGYVGGNMFIYFSAAQIKNQDFRGPDVFVVLGVPKKERKSWVVWEEEKAPDVVIELISDSTAIHDKTEKKQIYQDRMRVPEYFWYDPFNPNDFSGFTMRNGVYESILPDNQNRLISQRLELSLVRWYGVYHDIETIWLRWANLEGELLATSEENAQIAQQQAQIAQQQAQIAQQQAQIAQENAELAEEKAKKLAAKLKEMGINPEDI